MRERGGERGGEKENRRKGRARAGRVKKGIERRGSIYSEEGEAVTVRGQVEIGREMVERKHERVRGSESAGLNSDGERDLVERESRCVAGPGSYQRPI